MFPSHRMDISIPTRDIRYLISTCKMPANPLQNLLSHGNLVPDSSQAPLGHALLQPEVAEETPNAPVAASTTLAKSRNDASRSWANLLAIHVLSRCCGALTQIQQAGKKSPCDETPCQPPGFVSVRAGRYELEQSHQFFRGVVVVSAGASYDGRSATVTYPRKRCGSILAIGFAPYAARGRTFSGSS